MTLHDRPFRRRDTDGVAIIIVLIFVVLLAAVVIAFLSRTSTDRQIAHGDFNDAKSDVLARSALDLVVSDLKQEIVTGSNGSTVGSYPIYIPSSNANMVPMRSGNPGGNPDPIPNLVRRSIRSDSIIAPGVASRASAINSTTDASLNSRSISAARWNKHYLIPKLNTLNDQTDPVASFTAPDWVLSTTNGPKAFSAWTSSVKDPTSAEFVLGRYAYAIYDEGGLLDINVAGYPTGTTVVQAGRKGSVAYADLTTLPYPLPNPSSATVPVYQVDRLVGWRNYSTTQPSNSFPGSTPPAFAANFQANSAPASAFFQLVTTATNGFLTTSGNTWNARTDQSFTSRQQLIAYRAATNFSPNALQYLGTFSRELNRPSWTPTLNAVDMGAANNGPGNVYAYKDNAASATAINRNIGLVRVTGTFLRRDGTTAIAGEPLLKRRYPLIKINELATTSNTSIQSDFGLTWDSANNSWTYSHGNATRILRLDEVASAGREPDFFELLKAVILSGSVGLGSGPAATFVAAESKYYDTTNGASADNQIIQIGANIIDSWDSDNIPTFISFNGNEYAGIENLPYINKLAFCAKVPTSNETADAWLIPSLWNPHQNGNVVTATGNRVRIALTGSPSYTAAFLVGSTTYTTNAIVTSPPPSIDVSASGFRAPVPPQDPAPAPLATSGAIMSVNDGVGSEKYYGFHFAFTTPPTNSQVNKDNLDFAYPDFGTAAIGNVELQVQLANTTYKTYQKWNIAATGHPLTAQAVKNNGDWTSTNKIVDPEYLALDPRTLRFGIWGADANGQGGANAKKDASYGVEDSVDQGAPASRIENITVYKPQPSTYFTVSSFPANLSLYASNMTASNHYVDIDGVQRRGDWTTTAAGTTAGNTIMYASAKTAPAGNYLDRPTLLNSRFQSVAELGQIFRDQPWKTLNFTNATTAGTAVSADSGLLDVFSIQDVAMTAGRTSINTRQAPALAAILSNTTANLSGTSVITTARCNLIVTALMNLTVNGASPQPMINKAELVTRLMADSSVTGLNNKEARECVLRAFSDACQTRTWNLMIDVIAQSGRYPPNASALKDFVVEGEKRYWLHVAIDRFTGEVIDQQLEAVYE